MRTPAEVLVAARERIADPDNWIQYGMARDAAGDRVPARSPEAAQFCTLGALRAAAVDEIEAWRPGVLLREAAERRSGLHSLVDWNDTHTHAEVLEVWDLAIRLAQQPDRRWGIMTAALSKGDES